jgi:hypothetical protein
MAVTRLSDVIVPEVFFSYMSKDTTELSRIFQSGILRQDGELGAKLAGGGRTFNVPFWNDLDNTEASTGSDDPSQKATPSNLTASKDIARRQYRTKGWSTSELSGVLAGSDPMQRIRERVAAYWNRQFQRVLVATLKGVAAENVANHASDMIKDIGNDSSGSVTDDELVSAEAILDTAQTMGDNSDVLSIIIMHSVVATRLKKENLIDFIPNSEGKVDFARYLNKLVVIDDGVTTVQGANRVKYYTYLAGPGALGFSESPPPTPVAVKRDEAAGNGAGIETLWTRRQFVMHPYGIKWTDSSVGGEFPTNADLALAGNWSRVYGERKQIPIAFLVTNG